MKTKNTLLVAIAALISISIYGQVRASSALKTSDDSLEIVSYTRSQTYNSVSNSIQDKIIINFSNSSPLEFWIDRGAKVGYIIYKKVYSESDIKQMLKKAKGNTVSFMKLREEKGPITVITKENLKSDKNFNYVSTAKYDVSFALN